MSTRNARLGARERLTSNIEVPRRRRTPQLARMYPRCPNDPAVWGYNLHNHFIKSRSAEAALQFRNLWEIRADERRAMQYV